MDGPTFLALAHRAGAYGGVIAARQADRDPKTSQRGSERADGAHMVAPTKAALLADPNMRGLISVA